MKLSHLTASLFGVALVASTVVASVGPASAATPGVTFLTTADFAIPGSFSTTGWSNIGPGTLTQTPLNGMSANANVRPYYGFAGPLPTVGGTTLRDLADQTDFYVSLEVDMTAEISWFADLGETSQQYFYAGAGGGDSFSDPSAMWFASTTIGSIFSGDPATLDQFDAQLALDGSLAGASIQGVGLYNQGAPLIDIYGYTAGGEEFRFTPEPVFSAPTSIGQVDFGTAGEGVTVTTTGFVPGETVSTYLNTTESTSDPIDLIADADGAVTYTWIAPVTNMDAGPYEIRFVGLSSELEQFFAFAVTAQGLAATGVDATVPLAAGAVLLFGGVVLVAVTARRRKTA